MVLIYAATSYYVTDADYGDDESQEDLRGVKGGIQILIDLINETPPPKVKRVAVSRNILKNPEVKQAIETHEYTVVV